MRTQEDNKKERKELKDWKKPELEVLDRRETKNGTNPGYAESVYSGPFHGQS